MGDIDMQKTNFAKLTIAVALLTILMLSTTGCSPANSEQQINIIKPVKLYEVPHIDSNSYDAFLAEVDAGSRAQLSFKVAGVIEKLQVRDGQKVKKGEVLVSLDPTDYQLAVDARQTQYDLVKTRFSRSKKLHDKKLLSTDTFEQSETAFKAASANLKEAKVDLQDSKLKAPFDGLVSLSFVKEHQFVAAKTAILNIINNDKLDINISLPVPYVDALGVNVLKDKKFMVVFDFHSAMMYPAQFKEISTEADPATNTYKATVTIDRPSGSNLLTGMTGQVLIANTLKSNPLLLPEGAWISKQAAQGRLWRYNKENKTVTAIDVTINKLGAVVDGLSEGDLIVTAGAKDLKQDQSVQAWKREAGI